MIIHLDEIEIVDIFHSEQHFNLFFTELPKVLEDTESDKRINNYLQLEENLKDYLCFHVGFSNNQVVAFSGLYAGPWISAGWARALTRTYYSRNFREQTLRGHKLPGFATKYMLPLQIQIAKLKKLEGIFVSMENASRRQYFQEIFCSVRKTYPDQNWLVLDQLFNTCKRMIDGEVNDNKACWQNIAMLKLTENAKLPLVSKATFNSREGSPEC
jgi:hypothetical protein